MREGKEGPWKKERKDIGERNLGRVGKRERQKNWKEVGREVEKCVYTGELCNSTISCDECCYNPFSKDRQQLEEDGLWDYDPYY